MAAIAVGADWVFLPERPPPLDQVKYGDNWVKEMCDTIDVVSFNYTTIPHLESHSQHISHGK